MINEIRTTFLHRIYRVSLRVPTISFINIKPVNYNKQRPIVNNFLITRISCREILSTREQPRVNFNLRSNKIIPSSPPPQKIHQSLRNCRVSVTRWVCIIINKKKKKKEFSNISVIFLSNFDFRIFFFFFYYEEKEENFIIKIYRNAINYSVTYCKSPFNDAIFFFPSFALIYDFIDIR